MKKNISRWFYLPALALLLLPSLIFAPAQSAAAQGGSQTFPETGKTVTGKILDFWKANGGLAQFGYPISDQMQEVSITDGKTYTSQFFERGVLELHPENKAPFDVLLGLIGTFQYNRKYPDGAPGQKASTAAGAVKFPETAKTVGGKFLAYWQSHGGVAQQGYPISDEFQEKSELDGKTYTVQYFQRAVFESHPENSAPNDVLLSQLGKYEYVAENDLSFTDATGTKITLTKRPERIACVVALCEDILFELGLEPVATNDKFYQNPEFWGSSKTFPTISGTGAQINPEDIAKAKPDLVIGFVTASYLRDALKNVAPLYLMNPSKYQDSIDLLRKVGYLTGRSYQAEVAIRKFIVKLGAYRAKSPNNKVPLIIFGSNTNFNIFTQGSLFGSVISSVNNYPWPDAGPGGSTSPEPGALQYSLEQILATNPDVLLLESPNTGANLSSQLSANPIWSQLKAVQTKQAYEVRRDVYVTGRGPLSLSIALDDAMMKIYPDVFKAPLP